MSERFDGFEKRKISINYSLNNTQRDGKYLLKDIYEQMVVLFCYGER